MKKRKIRMLAFTLIELLVVMAIVAILAAMIIPKVGSAKGKAFQTNCSSNVKNIVKAMLLYVQDYPEATCPGASTTGALPATDTMYLRGVFGAMYYTPDGDKAGGISALDMYVCPGLKSSTHAGPTPNQGAAATVWHLPLHTSTSESPTKNIDYVLFGDLPNLRTSPDSNALITEKTKNHGDGRNVGFVGGYVKLLTDDDLSSNSSMYKNTDSAGKLYTSSLTTQFSGQFVTESKKNATWTNGTIN
ncbi:MAG: prepilin-type N-terminal cleavage/methylation domain-containing protein [Candidatus Aureabacteria bacterium]|nr:prepilin-type N-terminal cleavage/methylation domain-containing protein [Candidatus Auribacterota bacterium]